MDSQYPMLFGLHHFANWFRIFFAPSTLRQYSFQITASTNHLDGICWELSKRYAYSRPSTMKIRSGWDCHGLEWGLFKKKGSKVFARGCGIWIGYPVRAEAANLILILTLYPTAITPGPLSNAAVQTAQGRAGQGRIGSSLCSQNEKLWPSADHFHGFRYVRGSTRTTIWFQHWFMSVSGSRRPRT